VVAPVFATNCCVVVSGEGSPGSHALVIDAGAGVAPQVIDLVERQGWQVQAVLATHGHVDHTWDAAKLCAHFGVPFWIHAADEYRLADPFTTLMPAGAVPSHTVAAAIAGAVGAIGQSARDYQVPAPTRTFEAETTLDFGEVTLGALHAPGHTEGSTIYLVPDASTPGGFETACTGDVLFAGSIGRTDLPGGDLPTMEKTLDMLKVKLAPELRLIPGHGPESTMAHEIKTNPYLR
jgi:glyoxylase-like metal-dependent hydrolase (beta-lactamase superfamily II)